MGWFSDLFGGGGGGDEAARVRQDEARREQDMAEAIAQINVMFGVTPELSKNPLKGKPGVFPEELTPEQSTRRKFLIDQLHGSVRPDSKLTPDDIAAMQKELYALPEESRGSRARDTSTANKALREGLYTRSRGDIMNQFRSSLDKQNTEAASAIALDMARRGLTAGSAKVGADQRRGEQYDVNLADLTNRADSAVSGMRTADEQSRLDLISRIRQGMDVTSAVAGANNTLQNSVNQAKSQALTGSTENLFRDINEFYGQKRAYDAYQTGYGDTLQGVKPPGVRTASTGTVVR